MRFVILLCELCAFAGHRPGRTHEIRARKGAKLAKDEVAFANVN